MGRPRKKKKTHNTNNPSQLGRDGGMSKLPTNAKDEAQIRDETYTETTVKGWFDAPEDDGCLPPLSRTQVGATGGHELV